MTTGRINQVDTILEKFPGPPATPEGAGRRHKGAFCKLFQHVPKTTPHKKHRAEFTPCPIHSPFPAQGRATPAQTPKEARTKSPTPHRGRAAVQPPTRHPTKGTRWGTRPLPHQLHIYRSAEQTRMQVIPNRRGEVGTPVLHSPPQQTWAFPFFHVGLARQQRG